MGRARVTWTCALTTLVVGLTPAAAQGGTLTISWQPEPEDGDYDVPTHPRVVFLQDGGGRGRRVRHVAGWRWAV